MVQSRSSRLPSSADERFTKDAPVADSAPYRQHHQPTPPSHDADALEHGGPPAKKRKLSFRHRQTTLDHFAIVQSDAPKPPTRVTTVQPHGQLVETLNGVRTGLNADLDDVAIDTTRVVTLVRLPPPPPPTPPAAGPEKKEEKRTLRSQDDGPRLKCELAVYFPNYEEIVFDVQKEEDFITVDTALYVTDDAPKQHPPDSAQTSPHNAKVTASHDSSGTANGAANGTPSTPHRANSQHYNGCSPIDLDVLARNIPDRPDDPLDDAHFLKSHRRAERREKQLRNIEKEHAMHEKVQLERLLDGLLGYDWLKVLGITGITDGEAKKYEQKRDYFIAEVQSLVDKFKQWKEQEKRQRLEKEAAAAREAEESEEPNDTEDGSVEPPSSEMSASASRQLQQETINAVKSGFKIRLGKRKDNTSTSTPASASISMRPPPPFVPTRPLEPITSFYAKRHLRDAALSKTRHGRNVTAFGHTVPELDEMEFRLPEDYVTEDTLRANARERRRRKRANVADAASV